MITHLCSLRQPPISPFISTLLASSPNFVPIPRRISTDLHPPATRIFPSKRNSVICGAILPVDPWAPNVDSQSIASQVFALSLFPYIGFLFFITKSKTAPKLTLFGFYFLLAFVGATIPAGIYAKVKYGTSLSNVDWLHGGAESLLTLTNLFIVLGLRGALRKSEEPKNSTSSSPVLEEIGASKVLPNQSTVKLQTHTSGFSFSNCLLHTFS